VLLLLYWWYWSGEVDDREAAAAGNPHGVDKGDAYRLGRIAVGLITLRADQESVY
jgi:hypothetical protein